MPAIVVDKLTKWFPVRSAQAATGLRRLFAPAITERAEVVREISFQIDEGERVAFIGPNGAGKSTTLKMLTGILHPSSGDARVAGFVPWLQRHQLAHRVGIVFGQRSQLWYHLPVRQSFELLARLYAVPRDELASRLDRLAQRLAIADLLDRRVAQLSLGQRLRCEIAATLLHKPAILLLDEPTIGLDVTAKAALRDHLSSLSREEGTTVLLTSHDTGDIERICDRAIVIDHGAILLDQPIDRLRQRYLGPRAIVLVTHEKDPAFQFPGVNVIASEPYRITLAIDTSQARVDTVVAEALQRFQVRDLLIENTPLEEVVKSIYATAEAGQGIRI
ncbi:MAG: ATP-binding cassette domain-containing protein [Reyranella sp.]|uniref:ABC transporter ATP-binding protein n=1 Tax=Reyranella sp. TaxID=1929291 RepID=UPI003D0D858C